MKKTLKASLWLTLAIILSTAGTFQVDGYIVTKLSYNLVVVKGINNMGQISGLFEDDGGGYHGVILTGDTFTPFDAPNSAGRTWAGGINDSGQIVGNCNSGGFIRTGTTFTTLNDPDEYATTVRGINNSGNVVGPYITDSFYDNLHGFIYTGGGFTHFDIPDSNETLPYGINNKGQIVGYYWYGFGHAHGFIKNGDHVDILAVPGATETFAFGINNLGQVVGYYQDSNGTHGFIYTGGNFTTLDIPGGSTQIIGINDSGQILGECSTGPFTAIPSKKSIASISQLLLAE